MTWADQFKQDQPRDTTEVQQGDIKFLTRFYCKEANKPYHIQILRKDFVSLKLHYEKGNPKVFLCNKMYGDKENPVPCSRCPQEGNDEQDEDKKVPPPRSVRAFLAWDFDAVGNVSDRGYLDVPFKIYESFPGNKDLVNWVHLDELNNNDQLTEMLVIKKVKGDKDKKATLLPPSPAGKQAKSIYEPVSEKLQQVIDNLTFPEVMGLVMMSYDNAQFDNPMVKASGVTKMSDEVKNAILEAMSLTSVSNTPSASLV